MSPNISGNIERLTPEKYASFPSRMTFFWLDPFVFKGWRRQLNEDDLSTPMMDFRTTGIVPAWDKAYEVTKAKADTSGQPLSVLPILARAFGPYFAISSALQLVFSITQFASPQLVSLLINFVSSDEPDWKGYLYVGLLVGISVFNTIVNAQMYYYQYCTGLKVKTALISAIYRKSLRLSNVGRKEMSGKVSCEWIIIFLISQHPPFFSW